MALQKAIRKYGATDVGSRGATSAAGINGFVPQVFSPADAALYSGLRQHRIDQGADSGTGGHCTYEKSPFIQNQILSLFCSVWAHVCPMQAPQRAPAPLPVPTQSEPPTLPLPVPNAYPAAAQFPRVTVAPRQQYYPAPQYVTPPSYGSSTEGVPTPPVFVPYR